jgi:hypothetical protein
MNDEDRKASRKVGIAKIVLMVAGVAIAVPVSLSLTAHLASANYVISGFGDGSFGCAPGDGVC